MIQYQDSEGRQHLSAIVHWQHKLGPAHCLVQTVLLSDDNTKIFLVDLKTCHWHRTILSEVDNVANKIWEKLEIFLPDLSKRKAEWFFRYGPYSAHDTLGTHGIMRINVILDNEGKLHDTGNQDYHSLTSEEIETIKKLTNVAEVEDDLAKLPKMPDLPPGEW